MLPLYKFLKFIFRYLLPEWSRYPLARGIARWVIRFNPQRREVIVANLTPLVGPERARELASDLLGNFLMTAVDFFCPRRNIAVNMPFDNWSTLEKAYRKTKRVVIVTAHLGNWEVGISCLVEKGFSVAGVYAPYREDEVVRWILAHRNTEAEWIPAARGAVEACVSAIERGRVLGMVADIPFGEQGRRVTIAGRQAHLPIGPWAIAIRARAVVLPAFIIRESPGHYHGFMHDPIVPGEGSLRSRIIQMQNVYVAQLEHYLRTYPTQWGCLQSFWDKI